jgi:hypothetical protein
MRVSLAFSGALGAGLALVLLAGGAAAAPAPADDGAKVGVGMICDSQAQAARFVELRAKGSKAEAAMAAVNRESRNPKACGLAAIAFKQDATLDSRPIDNRLVQVVRITVVAGYTGAAWQPMQGFVQYAVLEAEGIEV